MILITHHLFFICYIIDNLIDKKITKSELIKGGREMRDEKLKFYGGSFIGFLPTIIYIIISGICTIGFKYYSLKSLSLGAIIGIFVGFIFCKEKDKYWLIATEGIMDRGHARMRLVYITVGIFTAFLSACSIGNGFVWLSQIFHLKNGFFVVFAFFATALITMGCGQPITGLYAILPIIYPPGLLLGANPTTLLGAILSGVFLGDMLSPTSQGTVVTATTQKSFYNPNRETNNIDIIKYRLKYIVPIAIIASIMFFLANGNGNVVAGSEELLMDLANPKGLLMLIPLAILIFISFKTRNVFLGLSYGIFSAMLIGLAFKLIVFSDIVYIRNGVMGGILYDGLFNMTDIIMSSTLIFVSIGIMKESGAITDLGNLFKNSSFSNTILGTELIISLGMSLVALSLSGSIVAAILVFGPLANEVGQRQKIDPIRRANLLAISSYNIPVIFPLGSSFIMGVLAMLENLSLEYHYIDLISPFDMFRSSYFNILLFFLCIGWIFLGIGRKEEMPE